MVAIYGSVYFVQLEHLSFGIIYALGALAKFANSRKK